MLIYLNKLHREPGHLQDVIGKTHTIPLLDKFRTGYENNFYPHIVTGLEIGKEGGSLSFPLWKSIEYSKRDDHSIFTERLFVEKPTDGAPDLIPVSAKQRTSNDVYSVLFYKNIQKAIGDIADNVPPGSITDPRLLALEELSAYSVQKGRKGLLMQSYANATLDHLKRNPFIGSVGYESGGFGSIVSEIDTLFESHPNESYLITNSLFPTREDVPTRPLFEKDKTISLLTLLQNQDTSIRIDTAMPDPLPLWDVPINRRTAAIDDFYATYANMLKATDLVARCSVKNNKIQDQTLVFTSYVDRYMPLFRNRHFMENDLKVCSAIFHHWVRQELQRAAHIEDNPEITSLLEDGCDLVLTKTFADEIKVSVEFQECDSADIFEKSVYGTYFDLATTKLCSPSVGFSPSILSSNRVLGS